MEGYLWKSRYYKDRSRLCNERRRYCTVDTDVGKLCFKVLKEDAEAYKEVELAEIASVNIWEENSFRVAFPHIATHETGGMAFIFSIKEDCLSSGESANEIRDAWVDILSKHINAKNDGLNFVNSRVLSSAAFHGRYSNIHSSKNILGTGISGAVRLITRRKDNKPFALKSFFIRNINSIEKTQIMKEIDIQKSLDHPHVVRLIDIFVEPKQHCHLVLELCRGGELFRRMKKRGYFPEHYAGKLLASMLKALNYLHQNLIVHRDLKLENWLFRRPESETGNEGDDLALVDFGFSKRLKSEDEEMLEVCGTVYYIPPEVISGRYHGTSCDMWSFGVIAFMLLSGHSPFDSDDDNELRRQILEEPIPDIQNCGGVWTGISDSCKSFVLSLLERDPEQRLTAREALDHPWMLEILKGDIGAKDQEHIVSDSILCRLKNFSQYKELKRVAMEVIAYSLPHDEIRELANLFEKIDTDNDGYITLQELLVALKDHDNLDEKEIEEIFAALDEEGSGRVHVNEFIAGSLQERYHIEETHLIEAFQRLDHGRKCRLNVDDLKRMFGKCASKERILAIWENSGLGNNEISLQQFVDFMRSDGEKRVRCYREVSETSIGETPNEVLRSERRHFGLLSRIGRLLRYH